MTATSTRGILRWQGNWDPAATYVPSDVVFVPGTQKSYVALVQNTSDSPPSANWSLLVQGSQGAQGAAGVGSGSQGPQGAQGASGAAGSQGSQGTAGPNGSQGNQGSTGSQGSAGTTGTQGSQGNQGTQGRTGATGAAVNWRGTWSSLTAYVQGDGVTYLSTNYISVQAGTNHQPDTSPTFWSAMAGTQGPQGDAGPQGTTGSQGIQGTRGFQGFQGASGPQGSTGATGGSGSTGATGSQGPQGTQGASSTAGGNIPIGGVVSWWRPASSVPVPSTFVVADGRTLTSGQHAFPGISGSVTLPDLRHKMMLGANTANPDGTSATPNSDAVGGAPGIGGSGGSWSRDLSHTHTVNVPPSTSGAGGAFTGQTGSAQASGTTGSGGGGNTGSTHANGTTGTSNGGTQNVSGAGGTLNVAANPHAHTFDDGGHAHSVSAHTHSFNDGGHTHSSNIPNHTHSFDPPPSTTTSSLAATDIHTQYVGVLMLIRVL